MASTFSAVFDVLSPGRVQARQAVDKIRKDLRELNRTMQHIEERGRKEDARLERALTEALAPVAAQLKDLTGELRAVSERLAGLALRESQLRAVMIRDAQLEEAEPALESLLTGQGLADHVGRAVDAAALHLEPFPYVVVDDLLPDPLYDALIEGLPPAQLFADKPANKQQLKVPFEFAPAYARRVWRFMADVVAPRYITPVIVEKFRSPLTTWVRENWPDLGPDPLNGAVHLTSSDGRVLRRQRGYRIPPHRDPKWGFITCLVYLVRPGDNEAWGTQLYSVASDREARGAAPHWIDPASCTLVRDVSFRRNRALIFLNSAGAHGAAIPADAEPADLDRYAYQFRIGPAGASMGAMMDALSEERKPFWAGKTGDY